MGSKNIVVNLSYFRTKKRGLSVFGIPPSQTWLLFCYNHKGCIESVDKKQKNRVRTAPDQGVLRHFEHSNPKSTKNI